MSFSVFQIPPSPSTVRALLAGGPLATVSAQAEPNHDFTGLGLQGDRTSFARDVNDQGQILLSNNLPGKDQAPGTIRSDFF